MKKSIISLVLVVLVLSISTPAVAVLDPTPDLLGVYFDPNADIPDHLAPANVPFSAYFILTSPSAAEIVGFEFSYQMEVPIGMEGMVFWLGHQYPPGIIDITLPVYDPLGGEVILSWGSPQPTATAITLMTFQYMVLAPIQAHLTVGPVTSQSIADGLPAYWDATTVYPLNSPPCSGLINTLCGVATEHESFGAVKALYR